MCNKDNTENLLLVSRARLDWIWFWFGLKVRLVRVLFDTDFLENWSTGWGSAVLTGNPSWIWWEHSRLWWMQFTLRIQQPVHGLCFLWPFLVNVATLIYNAGKHIPKKGTHRGRLLFLQAVTFVRHFIWNLNCFTWND